MQLPALLPIYFQYLAEAKEDDHLLELLIERPYDFIPFFEVACEDETWSDEHTHFMKSALRWLTEQFINEKISSIEAIKIHDKIHHHYSILKPLIPMDIQFESEGKICAANSLLLSVSSETFQDIIHIQCYEKSVKSISIAIPYDMLSIMIECAHSGHVEGIWRNSQEFLFELLKQATSYKFIRLMELCQETIRRYVNADNVMEILILSHHASWDILREYCFEFINNKSLGLKLSSAHEEAEETQFLALEFYTFNDTTFEIFSQLKHLVTHLIFGGNLPNDNAFSKVLESCTNLFSLDISGTQAFSNHFADIPNHLNELKMSQCPWLTDAMLKKMLGICSNVKKLHLSSDIQLTFKGFSELQKVEKLFALDISRCHQIGNEDFFIILKACLKLRDLNLEECFSLQDKAFLELSRQIPFLESLNVSRCHLNDGALIEILMRCQLLRHLDISRCEEITERGLFQALHFSRKLESINIKKCLLSNDAIIKLKTTFQKIKIII